MMNKPELLAPAGNMECLIAAVRNGADAVYFGGGAFNARKGAANFTGDALREAIDFCRLRGVKTHITLNTLLLDRELEAALDFAALLYSLKADAVIVQDIGLAALIRKELPLLTVHASTQMGIHSIGGLRYCEKSGVSRAVLAREVPLSEIRRMHENSPVELEFFCHGALCMGKDCLHFAGNRRLRLFNLNHCSACTTVFHQYLFSYKRRTGFNQIECILCHPLCDLAA
jgi:putative protease